MGSEPSNEGEQRMTEYSWKQAQEDRGKQLNALAATAPAAGAPELADFARALRHIADNADRLATRQDVAEMASLRRQVEEQAVKAQRDGDLIDELRRHVKAMERSLDGLGRMRRKAAADLSVTVPVLLDALMVIEGECANYTGPASCRIVTGRTRRADCAAEAWCEQCVARDALERAGALRPAGLEDKP